jgi:hypothetical protein
VALEARGAKKRSDPQQFIKEATGYPFSLFLEGERLQSQQLGGVSASNAGRMPATCTASWSDQRHPGGEGCAYGRPSHHRTRSTAIARRHAGTRSKIDLYRQLQQIRLFGFLCFMTCLSCVDVASSIDV